MEAHMTICSWPVAERPREKLLDRGPQALSDAELLAIFLRTGMQGKTAVDLARDLLTRFGGLRPLLEADQASFCESPGLGPAKYVQLQAVLELGRRHLQEDLERNTAFGDPASVRTYLRARLRDRHREVFACLFLDTRHRLIACEELFLGTIDGASVHPREVVQQALTHKAAAVILAHNHPSGVAEPSRADQAITSRLVEALGLIEVRVLDHFIVGDGEPWSFAEHGQL
jgi:DNA repair protein RadC